MSDPNRRHGDQKMDKLEATVDKMRDDITDIKTKIYNGFEKSIKNTECEVVRLANKLDKMLWMLLSISFILIAGEIVRHFI